MTEKVSRAINALLADLSPLYAQECIGQPFPWEQAQQLVMDAFDEVTRQAIDQHSAERTEAVSTLSCHAPQEG